MSKEKKKSSKVKFPIPNLLGKIANKELKEEEKELLIWTWKKIKKEKNNCEYSYEHDCEKYYCEICEKYFYLLELRREYEKREGEKIVFYYCYNCNNCLEVRRK